MPDPPWWCLLRIAYQGLDRSPGAGGRSPSAPDAHGEELGLGVQACPRGTARWTGRGHVLTAGPLWTHATAWTSRERRLLWLVR